MTTGRLRWHHTWWRPWSGWSWTIYAPLWGSQLSHCSSPTSLSSHRGGWHGHLSPTESALSPGKAWEPCGDHVFDLCSAFNTIQPKLLRDKLELIGVDQHFISWVFDYLTNRPQFVRTQDWHGYLQYRHPSRNGFGSVLLHPVIRRLPIQHLHCYLQKFWWLYSSWFHPKWWWQGVQRTDSELCGLVPVKIPPNQRKKN